jgi:hypothetical protein
VFAYENICHTLELNADYLRRGLQEWRQRARVNGGRPLPAIASAVHENRIAV